MSNIALLALAGVSIALLLQNMSNPDASLVAKFKKRFLKKTEDESS